jgi:hypothetical protein
MSSNKRTNRANAFVTGDFSQTAYVVDIIWSTCHIIKVSWVVEISDEFRPELFALQEDVQLDAHLARLKEERK